MSFWIIIALLGIAFLLAGGFFLITRISKFAFVRKITGNKRWKNYLLGLSFLLVLLGILWLIFDFINAVVIMLHLVAIWLICDFIGFIIKKISKKTFKKYIAGILAICITFVYMGYGYFAANCVFQTDYALSSAKEIGNIRVIQFSDSHIGAIFSGKELSEYVERMNGLNPDVVVITGDFADDETSKEDLIDACTSLGKLKTKYGVFYVHGNHDRGYFSSHQRGYDWSFLEKSLCDNNVRILQDEKVLIDNRFYIIGRKDASSQRLSMEDLIADADKSKYSIVLDHQPTDYDAQEKADVDLVLSGHTHAGQMIPVNILVKPLGKNCLIYGHEKRGNTDFIVSSGIADWELKFKTGCYSEFNVIDIKQN